MAKVQYRECLSKLVIKIKTWSKVISSKYSPNHGVLFITT